MSERKSVTVRIAGEEHVIRASAPPEYTRACAKLVDDRIMEIRAKAGLLEAHKAAILAALSITDELFQVREQLADTQAKVSGTTARLMDQLQSALED
ncbi:MAG: cell division protein ZapA [Gemmatimonadales bacterium]|jgi:cell division protein ZapA|nr:MAG: cell division protein ZapA [Gemmatimonadales bacterium]